MTPLENLIAARALVTAGFSIGASRDATGKDVGCFDRGAVTFNAIGAIWRTCGNTRGDTNEPALVAFANSAGLLVNDYMPRFLALCLWDETATREKVIAVFDAAIGAMTALQR